MNQLASERRAAGLQPEATVTREAQQKLIGEEKRADAAALAVS